MNAKHSVDLLKLQAVQKELRNGFLSGKTKPEASRRNLLSRLEALVVENQKEFCTAIALDLGRPTEDSIVAELGVVIEEIHAAKANLKKWMKPRKKWMPIVLFPSRGYVAPGPFGVCLIIGPWNYPIQLLLAPLVSALAAGNCALLKPSELTPHSAQLLTQLIARYFPSDIVQTMTGGVELSQGLLELRWDFIFFTGSTAVGKIVARAAAQHLTPTVLELGGKSPCIVDSSADLAVTARRILWGKTLNAGQTCVAPDYILTPRENIQPLLKALKKVLDDFFPDGFEEAQSFCRIVNKQHFNRLSALMTAHTKELVLGGVSHTESNIIEPSFYVLDIAKAESTPLMQEEIFGPLLPIVALDSREQATDFINSREHPLALYIFSADSSFIKQVEISTQSGSFVANDTVIQLATSKLPFGGVGESGQGSYHGVSGFNAFSHHRSILKRPLWLDLSVRYRPMLPWKIWILRKLLNFAEHRKQSFPAS